jgi:hypothetical protein
MGLLPQAEGNWTHKTRAELKTATKSKTQVCSLLTFAYQLLNTWKSGRGEKQIKQKAMPAEKKRRNLNAYPVNFKIGWRQKLDERNRIYTNQKHLKIYGFFSHAARHYASSNKWDCSIQKEVVFIE